MRRMLALSVAALFLIPLALAAVPQEDPSKAPGFMAGSWILRPAQEGTQEEPGPGPITLVLAVQDGHLAGTAVIPIQGGEKRWPLVQPAYDGQTFSFKVDNGEMLLQGEMRRVGDAFEGNWKSADGGVGGRLTMSRKAG
jgi:hypothetical protein